MPNFSIPKTVNPDLAVERKNTSFNSEEFSIWFYGSKQAVDMRRLIGKPLRMNIGIKVVYIGYGSLQPLTQDY